jgi:2-phospho-L-lactate guanylyltransferase (CobY/MobA/RfbA family)
MTTVLVLADPPGPWALPGLSDVLDEAGRTRLATAFLQDACRAGAAAAGEWLVAVRDGEAVEHDTEAASEAVRDALDTVDAVDASAVRIERQVGSTPSARLGNAVTHLLEEEDASSVLALWPGAPLLGRADIDGAAMKLRQRSVVLAPATRGRLTLAGFSQPIDFTDALASPPLSTVVDRASDAGLEVDFVPDQIRVDTHADLTSLVVAIRARRRAERIVPPHTVQALSELGLRLTVEGTTPTVVVD